MALRLKLISGTLSYISHVSTHCSCSSSTTRPEFGQPCVKDVLVQSQREKIFGEKWLPSEGVDLFYLANRCVMIALFYFAFPVGSGLGYTSGFQMVATF